MISHIFDAVRARYNGHGTLRKLGRILRHGTESREHPCYATITMSHGDSLDTFSSDIDEWTLSFVFRSKSILPDDTEQWLEAMVDAFDDADLTSAAFNTAGCRIAGASGPERDEEMFTATTEVQLIVQRVALLPATRGA